MGSKQRLAKIICSVCETRSVFKCAGCKKAYYCSREHQKIHWKEHQLTCKKHKTLRKKSSFINGVKVGCNTTDSVGPEDCFMNAMNLRCYDELKTSVIKALLKVGVCVIDNYIHQEIAENIDKEIQALYIKPGFLHKPDIQEEKRIQRTNTNNVHRDDRVAWITGREKLCEKIDVLVHSFDNLLRSINFYPPGGSDAISHKSQLQLSCFSAGSHGYKLHIDNPNNNGRLLTTQYFCNVDYNRERDGGVSRFYVKNRTKFIDVEPKFNRAVFYWSDARVMHEVLPCARNIFSLTSWYFGRTVNTIPIQKQTEKMNKSMMRSSVVKSELHQNLDPIMNREDPLDDSISHDTRMTRANNQFNSNKNIVINTHRTPVSSDYFLNIPGGMLRPPEHSVDNRITLEHPLNALRTYIPPAISTRVNATPPGLFINTGGTRLELNNLRRLTPSEHYMNDRSETHKEIQMNRHQSVIKNKLYFEDSQRIFKKPRRTIENYADKFYRGDRACFMNVEFAKSRLFKPKVLAPV